MKTELDISCQILCKEERVEMGFLSSVCNEVNRKARQSSLLLKGSAVCIILLPKSIHIDFIAMHVHCGTIKRQ